MQEFKDFTFPSSNGKNTIHARMCLPDSEPRGIVQIAHGIAEHIERYDGFMEFLAEHGFIAVGNDHLGHGDSYNDPANRGFFSDNDGWKYVVDDMDALHEIMCRDYPGLPYIFFGHSMGSFLTRTYLIRYPDKPDLAIICGTGHQQKAVAMSGYGIAQTAVKIYGPRKNGEMLNNIAFGSYNKKYDDVRTPFDWICFIPALRNASNARFTPFPYSPTGSAQPEMNITGSSLFILSIFAGSVINRIPPIISLKRLTVGINPHFGSSI